MGHDSFDGHPATAENLKWMSHETACLKKGDEMKQESNEQVLYHISLLSDDDLYLFNQGSHFRLYEKLGAHPMRREGLQGSYFAVWAPDAEQVFVMGDFNGSRCGHGGHL
jgi:hypothetical protein